MKFFQKIICVIILFLTAAGTVVFAQGFSFFEPLGANKKQTGEKKAPTVITSDTIDIYMAKNSAVFIGNVVVDDEEMHITCDKMTIYFEDVKKQETGKTDEGEKKEEGMTDPQQSKKISRIICEGDVVIIRKAVGENKEKQEEQKALAGNADFNLKTGEIVLTQDRPKLMRGDEILEADVINYWKDSGKAKANGNVILKFRSDSINEFDAADGDKKEEVKEEDKGKNKEEGKKGEEEGIHLSPSDIRKPASQLDIPKVKFDE